METLLTKFSVSKRRACRVLAQPRSSQRYEGKPKDEDERLQKRILELVRQRPRWGYRRIGALLRLEGEAINLKRTHRLWHALGLKVPQKRKRKLACGEMRNACDVQPAAKINDVWTWDFVHATTVGGQTVRFLNVVDEYTRRCLTIKASRSITSEDAIDTLAELFAIYGVPKRLRSDNGPEFIANGIEARMHFAPIAN